MKGWEPLAGIVFVAVLAYVIGIRLSESAMAVTLGVIFGVATAIPTSILSLAVLRDALERRPRSERARPVIYVLSPDATRALNISADDALPVRVVGMKDEHGEG